jgi:ADP-ribosyl-[dinitrogen reductase] hydrolase
MYSSNLIDRARGCLLGLAVGDALGTTLEFCRRDSLPHQRDMTGGGPFNLEPGQWTDDTAMALALGESLVACRGFDLRDVMDRFVSWWRVGDYSCTGTCFDIGTTTADALRRYRVTNNPFAGQTAADTAGNGSLMRLAPAALFGHQDPDTLARLARDQSRLTHGAPQAVEGCALFAALLCEALHGADKAAVLAPRMWEGHPAVRAVARAAWSGKDRSGIRASGYVIHTMEAALWAVGRTETFEDALILAVNLGDDADTVGAVTGQLAGALYGASGIPDRWLRPLAWVERIASLAEALVHRGAPSVLAESPE